MGLSKILRRANRNNAGGVNRQVTGIVVRLDMRKVCGFGNTGHLIKLPHITTDRRIIGQQLAIGFEMPEVHCIKTNQPACLWYCTSNAVV